MTNGDDKAGLALVQAESVILILGEGSSMFICSQKSADSVATRLTDARLPPTTHARLR
jgi:hypothetical protein